jgi:DNA-binding protein WhiA
VRQALAVLGDTAPPDWAAAAQLRLAHPDLTLPRLAELASPPLTKDTIAGRIRRLIEMAGRKASMREVAAA